MRFFFFFPSLSLTHRQSCSAILRELAASTHAWNLREKGRTMEKRENKREGATKKHTHKKNQICLSTSSGNQAQIPKDNTGRKKASDGALCGPNALCFPFFFC
ncbi:hypothetical protein FQA47_012195 [Oryzias melastigma]|uniref:Uncharacterized protein n=1 Tax=Oryzias melastigma TaxID=30732 RepID=A0A834FJ56_ORYME|nr:hypothetical protein FQA47_012195 [Oryzias melastigma]